MAADTPFSHILVPVDGSDASIHAGRVAMDIASTHHIPITFVYVVDRTVVDRIAGTSSESVDEVCRELEEKGRRYVDYLAVQAHNKGLQADQVIRHGMPHSEIIDLARELNADLIAIGQGSRSGPRRSLIGSVAARVVEYAHCPVLVVKPFSDRG
jgi:nucleotide-binding universal stress UspA family protein